MQNHRREERSVEPWEWAVKSSDKAPRQCLVDTVSQDRQRESRGTHKIQITGVVDFASLSICQIISARFKPNRYSTYTSHLPEGQHPGL